MSRVSSGSRLLCHYSTRDQAVISLTAGIAANFSMKISVVPALEDPVLFIEFRGRSMRIGDITQVLAMTTRGLIGIFEAASEAWRDGIEH